MIHRWLGMVVFQFALAGSITIAASGSGGPPKPGLDAEEIIEASYGFLREREPTMSESEYALYERVVPMVKLQPDFALRLLEGMIGESDTSAAFDLALGNVYFEQQRFAQSEERYREALRKYPNFIRGWDNLGVLFFSREQFSEAVPCFSKVVSLGGWEPRIFGLLGFCLAQSHNPVAAELAYSQAYAIESDNPDWIEGLLQVLLLSKQYDRAESLLRQLIRLEPDNTQHWVLLANVLISLDRKLDAAIALDIASELRVLDSEGMLLLGDLYVDAGFIPEAVATYRRLADSDSELGVERLLRYAGVLIESDLSEEADKLLADIEPLIAGAQRVEFLRARSASLIKRKEWGDARRVLDSLLALDPLNGRALLRLSEVQLASGEEIPASLTLESATRIPDVAYIACLRLAELKVKQREFNEALALLDKALRLEASPLVRDYYSQVKALADSQP